MPSPRSRSSVSPARLNPRPVRRVVRLAVVVAVVVAVLVPAPRPATHVLEVAGVRDLGTLVQPAGWLRDGGQSTLVGSRILWTFGDTLFPVTATDGSHLRSNTAAWSDPSVPRELEVATDTTGVPIQFIPFDFAEEAYNRGTGRSDDRMAVWPLSAISLSEGTATVFFQVMKISPGPLNYQEVGSGIATGVPASPVAARDPALLFRAPEPTFGNGAVLADGFVFVYGCGRIEGLLFGCRVARVPPGEVHVRSAYRFWDGSGWTADVGAAVFALPGPSGGLSVSWNPWLGRYLAVYNLGLTNRILVRTAPRPEGPWSRPVPAFSGRPVPAGTFDYAAVEHPELARDGGRTVTISYFHPISGFVGEIRLVEVTFA